MEEVERRFAGSLVLSDRESKGLRIGGLAARSALKYQFAVVCKVLTDRTFRRQSFIDLFSRLWGGDKGVTISDVEGNRFLACFQSEGDMRRVLYREPWDFDNSLIVMAPMGDARAITEVSLGSAVFWVQAHGVPWKFHTPEVAEDIGGMLGEYKEVKADEKGCCVGRCVCIRVCLDISLSLLRRTVVNFSEFGDQLIEFQYERVWVNRAPNKNLF
ncbi:uncharacterized protein LOC121051163 [Rosa chinensis]|uniref:uncharacterized protein LOC121051163 n=1 Tax=Rosa chinensis TaxID=74649 RepID=UPI001AD8FB79|nr:uncharacterized protein LOC121051163 [Rosa chinensis]